MLVGVVFAQPYNCMISSGKIFFFLHRIFYKMNDVISSIPEDLKLSLAKLLDRRKEPNWKTFVAKTPKNIYAFSKGEYESLRLNILKADGSPTMQLIEKLGKKNVQICHFIDILESLEKDENIYKALDLFMGGIVRYMYGNRNFKALSVFSRVYLQDH